MKTSSGAVPIFEVAHKKVVLKSTWCLKNWAKVRGKIWTQNRMWLASCLVNDVVVIVQKCQGSS